MKNIVITGVTSGFGINWLYQLDRAEEIKFFVLARNEEKFNRLLQEKPLNNAFSLISSDLSSLDSIRAATEEIKQQTRSVDVLINNAGVWSSDERALSKDGVELTVAVNHLAPYYLTGLLLELLENAESGRVVTTASFRHADAKVGGEDLERASIELTSDYTAEQAYCNSKLFNILFTRKLAEKVQDKGITANCFDPGMVDTPMLRDAFPKGLRFLYPLVRRFMARTPEKGAETGHFLATSASCGDISGQYFKDSAVKKTHKVAHDRQLDDWLWRESARLTSFTY